MRTIGVGLVAIAALAASRTIARQRSMQKPGAGHASGETPAVIGPNLDAIRSAGL